MIPLINHDSQWGRGEVVKIYPYIYVCVWLRQTWDILWTTGLQYDHCSRPGRTPNHYSIWRQGTRHHVTLCQNDLAQGRKNGRGAEAVSANKKTWDMYGRVGNSIYVDMCHHHYHCHCHSHSHSHCQSISISIPISVPLDLSLSLYFIYIYIYIKTIYIYILYLSLSIAIPKAGLRASTGGSQTPWLSIHKWSQWWFGSTPIFGNLSKIMSIQCKYLPWTFWNATNMDHQMEWSKSSIALGLLHPALRSRGSTVRWSSYPSNIVVENGDLT